MNKHQVEYKGKTIIYPSLYDEDDAIEIVDEMLATEHEAIMNAKEIDFSYDIVDLESEEFSDDEDLPNVALDGKLYRFDYPELKGPIERK